MALHKEFPNDPCTILAPDIRWFPADESLRDTTMDKLMPPLVPQLRRKVKQWRDSDYQGATDTSKNLLNWWFAPASPHLLDKTDGLMSPFEYYFAQREALETIVYLVDVAKAKDKYDLMRFAGDAPVTAQMFDESWRRYVIKMATGSGKTKVMSLALAWSFFHKTYEKESNLARNFLVIAPNIIVLDRLYKDFQGLNIFFQDPVIPDNGFEGRNWRDDFQLTLHKQDQVNITQPTGNIFLTNIHRVYENDDTAPSPDDENMMDYFLGKRPTGATTDSKVDLGEIVRDIDELVVLNDEAHHVHDKKLAWFKSIEDIHNHLLQKESKLSLQIDTTATPRHNNGAIFVQTVSDYPLVEAIAQDVVKHPVLPDEVSRSKLTEKQTIKYTQKYSDYLELGVAEWHKAYIEHQKMGKKAILFVMTDDTKNCDEVAEYLEKLSPDLSDAVLVIHTNKSGDVSEAQSGKAQKELEILRKQANEIDSPASPYKAIVSVMMLKEGWDVRNVTTIVGLRSYSAKSNILPEQTLGRGLRKMYASAEEKVSVIGTDAFMDFVESIKSEGVELERAAMGQGATPPGPQVVEIDKDNDKKDLNQLDIEIPVLTPRLYREYKNLADLDVSAMRYSQIEYKQFSDQQQREIIFRYVTTGDITHKTVLELEGVADYRSVIGYFAKTVMKELRLFSGYDVLYPKMKMFIQNELFNQTVDLESANTLRNLSEPAVSKTIIDTFIKAINDLTVQDKGDAEIRDSIKLRNTRPFVTKDQDYVVPEKSVFNKVIGDSGFELAFARYLDSKCSDVVSYSKNYLAVGFKLDYVKADGSLSSYIPDFFVKLANGKTVVVETKGREELDLPQKIARLRQWCEDVNCMQKTSSFDFVYVDEDGFEKYQPKSFAQLMEGFTEYKNVD